MNNNRRNGGIALNLKMARLETDVGWLKSQYSRLEALVSVEIILTVIALIKVVVG